MNGALGRVLIGYMRVSTGEQSLALQRDARERTGCERIYDDVCSGRATDRPGLSKALDAAREGDAVKGGEIVCRWAEQICTRGTAMGGSAKPRTMSLH